jgi:hypothetical protein
MCVVEHMGDGGPGNAGSLGNLGDRRHGQLATTGVHKWQIV